MYYCRIKSTQFINKSVTNNKTNSITSLYTHRYWQFHVKHTGWCLMIVTTLCGWHQKVSKMQWRRFLGTLLFNCKLVRSVWCEIESTILGQIGHKVEISLTDSLFINRHIIIANVCLSKFRYGKHPNLTFKNELNLRNWNILQIT